MPRSPRSSASIRFAAALAAAVVGAALVAAPAGASAPDGDYIVVLKDAVAHPSDVAAEHRRDHGAQVRFTYGTALKGYAARLSGRALAEVRSDRRVAYVEPDGVATTVQTQTDATWGLDRVDARAGLDMKYTYEATGSGVTAYVIDTGILAGHADFGGRVTGGFDAFGGNTVDCNGHGTHVAGTIGGATYGVAKTVTLVPVRVLDCNGSGTWAGVIAGIDWVATNRVTPAVANLSLGGGASTAVDQAVESLIASGVTTAVAAGNGNQAGRAQDACGYSPARVPAALTIGATTNTDAKASYSNYGSCVDLFAPGSSITSAWHSGANAMNTISGTSMAAPHVVGAAALHLQANAAVTPAQVETFLEERTTKNIVTSSSTLASNDLLYVGGDADPGLRDPTNGGGGGKPGKNSTK